MIWSLLEFGTIWFWLLVLVASGFITASTESDEDNFPASIWFIASLALLYFFGNSAFFKSIGAFILTYPGKTLAIFLGYVFIGTVWSIIKWFFYLNRVKETWYENRRKYPSTYSNSKFSIDDYKATEHKERIIHWMLYWPFSGIWTLINDPVRHAFQWVLVNCGGIFDSIAAKVFKDLPTEPKK